MENIVEEVHSYEPNDIQTENEILKAENAKLKEQLISMKAENERLYEKNQQLMDDFAALKNMCSGNGQEGLIIKLLEKRNIPKMLLFNNHENVLGHKTIEELKQLDDSEQKDSTFILKCMKKIFENDCLNNVTASGRAKTQIDKTILDDLFTQRLAHVNIEYVRIIQRYSRFNRLVNSARNNILRVSIKLLCITVTKNISNIPILTRSSAVNT